MCCESCNKWQHIRCHDQADFIAGRPRRNWELVDFVCHVCATTGPTIPRGPSSHQPQRHYADVGPQVLPNRAADKVSNGIVPTSSQPLPAKPTHNQASYENAPYSNGRTNYTIPQAPMQQTHSTSAVLQRHYAHRPASSAVATGHLAYSGPTSPQSHVLASSPAPPPSTRPPYTGPNMYLSNYSGVNRPPQNPAPHPAQPSSSSHYRPMAPAAQTNTWSQQQVHYNQLASYQPWNRTTHASVPQHYISSGTGGGQPVQQNRYYRPHPTAPPNPVAPPNHLQSAQPYYTDGPSSQS